MNVRRLRYRDMQNNPSPPLVLVVETEAQLRFLESKGYHEIQGYYFSRPLPTGELDLLLRQNLGTSVEVCDDPCLVN